MSANTNPILPCEENEVVKIALTTLRETNLEDDFIPVVKLDKTYEKNGFKYTNSNHTTPLSPYIEERDYVLETVEFDGKDEIVLRFEVKKGNSVANDNRGCINAIGRGVKIISQTEFTIKYDQKILLRISKKDIKNGAYIDFYANDNDWKYYTVSNVHCGRVRINANVGCSICGNEHTNVDLRKIVEWQTQFSKKWGDSSRQKVACKRTCDSILNSVGLKSTSNETPRFQTSIENDTHTKLTINTEEAKKAIKYLNSELEIGHPVLVGVNHTLNYKAGNADNDSTDHFVVIIGQNCDEKGMYYMFYEVGTSHKAKGTSDSNKLYLDTSDYSLKGKPAHSEKRNYTVTQIRKNI